MKLDNKGFAITGILYTLFILFLLILVTVLSGLSSKKNLLEQSIISQEDSFTGQKIEVSKALTADNVTTVNGKYIFLLEGTQTKCVAYLKYGININDHTNITYIPNDCNNYDANFILTEVYSFEKE